MAKKPWASKVEYSHLSGELACAEKRVFETRALPLLRIIWPDAVGVPEMLSFDRSGIDHFGWSDQDELQLVVQCKGWSVRDEELGTSQIKLCTDSIESFRKSGRRTKTYVLVHNRTGKNREFHAEVEKALNTLVTGEYAQEVFLYDRQTFLHTAFDRMFDRVREKAHQKSKSTARAYRDYEPELCAPLEQIPYTVSELTVGSRELFALSPAVQYLDDPTKELLPGSQNLLVMIGGAGYGKTTTALRSFVPTGRKAFYVRAAAFSQATWSTKALLEQCVDNDDLMMEFEECDHDTVRRVLRPVVEYLLKIEATPVALIIDGLDESIFFTRRGGIQVLFNMLQLVRVPVVLMARTEYWQSRQADFATAFGSPPTRYQPKHQPKNVRLVELLPWTTNEILLLARRFRETLTDPNQQTRIDALITVIATGKYEDFYGDIPRRPLFLRFILETTAERDVHHVSRAQLFREWAEQKIIRDCAAPFQAGGPGRAPIISGEESLDMTIQLAFLAMRNAAKIMVNVTEGALELLPDCSVDDIRASDSKLQPMVDHTGLVLNSLLLPVKEATASALPRIRFAHRAYQEFFLAWYLTNAPSTFGDAKVPASVTKWMEEIKVAGL